MDKRQGVTVSAPGKLLLLGDHAVVYGHPALVSAIDQRMSVSVAPVQGDEISIDASSVGVALYSKSRASVGRGDVPRAVSFVEASVKRFFERFPSAVGGVHITTTSAFSSTVGFGSSAATSVCVISALGLLFGQRLSPKDVFSLSYQSVLDVQGTGSGFDVAASTYGGVLYYQRGGETITPVAVPTLPLVIGYTGVKADTVSLILDVKKKYEKNTVAVSRIFSAIHTLVDDARERLIKRDWERLGVCMDYNQEYLRDLGVSSDRLESLITAAKDAGALGAKLSGAGGGDCMIALVTDATRDAVQQAITQAGGVVIPTSITHKGVRMNV